jgi:endonuclease/exonuclease/phosphatase family metal-dependent hydrolase
VAVAALLLAYLSTHISPEKAIFPALFGLAYGIILVTNLVFIVFWLLVKKRLALLSAIAIAIGFNHLLAYFQILPALKPFDSDQKKVRMLSQNVKLFGWYSWRDNKARRDTMLANLASTKADIASFQEFFHNTAPGVFGTRERLSEKLKMPYINDYYVSTNQYSQHYGIATYSKYPIVGKGEIYFKGEHGNICIFTDVDVEGDTLRIYNAHVASIRFNNEDYRFIDKMKNAKEDERPPLTDGLGILKRLENAYIKRANQVGILKEHINKSPYPAIVTGDFNDTPVSYSYARMASGLNDAFRESGWGLGSTYIGKFPSFRIDYIFHSPVLGSENYTRYPEQVSDHHAISCDLFWE